MNSDTAPAHAMSLNDCKRIRVILPDDGSDRLVIKALRLEHGITRVDTVAVRALTALQNARSRHGRLPVPEMARLVTVVVEADASDEVFDFIRTLAAIDRPGGGMILMDHLLGATAYELPSGVPDGPEWRTG